VTSRMTSLLCKDRQMTMAKSNDTRTVGDLCDSLILWARQPQPSPKEAS
jgi:hypothetical protein